MASAPSNIGGCSLFEAADDEKGEQDECDYNQNVDPHMEQDKRRRNDKEYEYFNETYVVKAGSKIASGWFSNPFFLNFVQLIN